MKHESMRGLSILWSLPASCYGFNKCSQRQGLSFLSPHIKASFHTQGCKDEISFKEIVHHKMMSRFTNIICIYKINYFKIMHLNVN